MNLATIALVLALVLPACVGGHGQLRSAYLAANDAGFDALVLVESAHQADIDRVLRSYGVETWERRTALARIDALWAPSYAAIRRLRMRLELAREALQGGGELDPDMVAGLQRATLAVELSLP